MINKCNTAHSRVVVAHAFNPSTQGQADLCEFEANLVYIGLVPGEVPKL